jgi:hypothetical protein
VVPLYFADTSRTIPQDVIVYDGMASEIVYTTDVNYAKSSEQAYGWVLTGAGDALYQIPVISMTDLTYGTYDVTVEARFTESFRHYKTDNNGNKYYDLTVDGVRVYEPAKTNASAYADGGNLVTFTNIRENAGNTSSMILVDGKNDLSAAQFNNYLMIAPKNEIYLKSGGTAVFEINASGCTDLRLGMKSANGGSCNVSIAYSGSNKTSSVTIDTATEMYYSVSGLVGTGSGTLTVTNNGSGILSLTKLMAVTPPQTASAAPRRLLTVNENTLANAHMLLDMQTADIAIHEESVQAQTGSDGTVTLTLTTGADAETVVIRDAEGNVIDPDSVAFTIADSGEKNWTVTFTEAREGTFTYTLQAEYENGYTGSAEPTEATVTVSFNTDPSGEDPTGEDPTGENPTGDELLGGLSDILAKLRSIFDILREFIRTIAALFR